MDGRDLGHWQSRYLEKEARNAILLESVYCVALLVASPLLLILTWLAGKHQWLPLTQGEHGTLQHYAYAWFGGLFGGTLFTGKWLYHSVAHWVWNKDRRVWRFISPHLSGGLACAFVILIDSGLVSIFNGASVRRPAVIVATAFLVGYFSDNALAKMTEIASSVFGPSRGSFGANRPPKGSPEKHGE
jgi:hypothetical protein